ncbi:MAG: tRNA (adenosine(37)-N6)-threonylcarbamoyltransferase complex ATPase subunit type 1 TsaE [Hydrogenimonas sp.]|nr:tRNA (adenosine(37)-N6)-threonylcarbamoyltransferase complex ATPase subunit type 1 TsaE [Hydrogenimonas sp.]
MKRAMSASLSEVEKVAESIAKSLPQSAVIFLRGDLAAGKTTLVKAIAKIKGCTEPVTSPTFSIEQVYDETLRHYDLYQCPNDKFIALGLLESLESPGWHLVEWGDEALRELLRGYGIFTAVVEIEKGDNKRIYRIETDA